MSGVQNLASTEELPQEEKEGTPTVSGDGERERYGLPGVGAMLETSSWTAQYFRSLEIHRHSCLLWGSLALCIYNMYMYMYM